MLEIGDTRTLNRGKYYVTQTLDALPLIQKQRLVCSYLNDSPQIQIARIANIQDWYFERVVFPGDYLLFETVPEATLEIHSPASIGSILADRIPCKQLCAIE